MSIAEDIHEICNKHHYKCNELTVEDTEYFISQIRNKFCSSNSGDYLWKSFNNDTSVFNPEGWRLIEGYFKSPTEIIMLLGLKVPGTRKKRFKVED